MNEGGLTSASAPKVQRVVRLRDLHIFDYPDSDDKERHLRRFATLLMTPDRMREGRNSRVYAMDNSWGETFAVKISNGRPLDEECACHKAVSGRLGFPRLFARGMIDGNDVLVMEWLEGETLEYVRTKIALDDKGRLSPLVVGRIGRDLCNTLIALDRDEAGIMHRDISTTNLFMRTSSLSIPQQVSEGTFDTYLVDFGSALSLRPSSTTDETVSSTIVDDVETALQDEEDHTSSVNCAIATETDAEPKPKAKIVATPAFAAPELLVCWHTDAEVASFGSASDVYALGSVLYLLLTGYLPYDIPEDDSETRTLEAARNEKLHNSPKPMHCAHWFDADIAGTLVAEPEVAVATGYALADFRAPLTPQDVSAALNQVDEQLCSIVLSCLSVDPDKRPSFAKLSEMLTAFCDNYKENIGHALRGEPLEPCRERRGVYALSHRAQTLIKRIGQGISIGIGAVVLASSAMLLNGTYATLSMDGTDPIWSGALTWWAVVLALMIPILGGYLIRWRPSYSKVAFIRGSIGLLGLWSIFGLLSTSLTVDNISAPYFMASTFITLFSTAWCVMVLDFAFPNYHKGRRKGLPAGDPFDILRMHTTDGIDTPRLEPSRPYLEAGNREGEE